MKKTDEHYQRTPTSDGTCNNATTDHQTWKQNKKAGWTKIQFLIGQIFLCLTLFYVGKMAVTTTTTTTSSPTTMTTTIDAADAAAIGSINTAGKQLRGFQQEDIIILSDPTDTKQDYIPVDVECDKQFNQCKKNSLSDKDSYNCHISFFDCDLRDT